MGNQTDRRGEWDDADMERLKVLWAEGLSAAEIGRRMGRSKNSVVGKAHRIRLSARPSPIKNPRTPAQRAEAAKQVAARRAERQAMRTTGTLLVLASVAAPVIEPPALPVAPPVVAPVVPVMPPYTPPLAYAGRVQPCCWPIGEPGARGFRLCEAVSQPRRPYCAEHCARAYAKPRLPEPAAPVPDFRLEQRGRLAAFHSL